MSLLMQALKKAERAKQNRPQDEELAKPSEAFDELLTFLPHARGASRAAPTLKPVDRHGADSLSLEPIDQVAPDDSGLHDPGSASLERAAPWPNAAAMPAGDRASDAAPRSASQAAPTHHGADTARPSRSGPPMRTKPVRVKVAPRQRLLIDPALVRMAVLGSLCLLVVLVFFYIWWNAMYGSGSSRKLAPVPMPGQSAGVAPPAIPAAPLAAAPVDSTPAPGSALAGLGAGTSTMPASPSAGAPSDVPPTQAPSNPGEQFGAAPQRAPEAAAVASPVIVPSPRAEPARSSPRPSALPPVAAEDSGAIHVVRGSAPAQVNAVLQNAYQLLNAGDFANARLQYEAVLKKDANNRDALLGLAALALKEGQGEPAQAIYLRLLTLDPNDGDALAGLTNLRQGDAVQSEQGLKRLLQRTPENGALLFALGNLYARQGRWPEAQQSYFHAYTSMPGNADYAFNLAVGLDRLNQGKLALGYYQSALTLGQGGAFSFERATAKRRIVELGGQLGTP